MLSLKIVAVLLILNVQNIFSRASVIELTSDEIDNFVNTLDTRVIYFETKDAQTKYPLFTEEYTQSAHSLDSYGVQFGKVNCSTEKHEYCSEPSDPSLFVFSDFKQFRAILHVRTTGPVVRRLDSVIQRITIFSSFLRQLVDRDKKLLKTFPIKKLNNEHSIVANILHRFLLKDELIVVQTEEDFTKILTDSRGKENIILTNVKEIGMKDHRNLLEVAFAYGDSFKFYLSTKLSKDMHGANSKLKAFLCKEKDCEVRHYDAEFRVITLATFIQSLMLPQAIILGEDEKVPYTDKDLVSIPVSQVYMFVKDIKDPEGYRAELEEVAKKVKSAVGFIVVQVEKHPEYMTFFGLAEDSKFPALGFIPGEKSKDEEDGELKYVDVLTPTETPLGTESLVDLVYDLISHPAQVFGKLVDSRSLTVNFPQEYLTLLKDLETDYLLIGFCKPSVEDCADFSYDYQRLSRTYDRHFQRSGAGKRIIKFSIIYSDQDMDPQFAVEMYPTVRLHKKGQPVTKFSEFAGSPHYFDMLDFVKKQIGERDVYILPSSGLDYIELENFHTGSGEHVGGNADEYTTEEHEDYEEEDRPPEETEDDEVAAAGYEIFYTRAVDDSHIPKLNDTNFNSTVKEYDISVVFFFLPWDARSQAFSPSYAAAAKKLVEPDGSEIKTGALQVNCFDWEDVCAKENVKLYPTVRFYRKMQAPMDYHGVLDESNLVKTVKLLQAPLPLKLTSDGEVVGFQEGKYPMTSILYTDCSVIGLFSVETSNYVSGFDSAARVMAGQFLYGYATGKTASDAAARLAVRVPSIVLLKRNDPLQNKIVFEGEYSEEAIVQFVKYSSLPKYGELTPLNFPTYFSKGQPFLIAFINKDNVEINALVTDVVKSGETDKVNFCWVDISVKVNRDILEAYTRDDEEKSEIASAIVFVNHQKGTTYTYKGELKKENLVSWMMACLSGSQEFTGKLETSEWKPRLEGYDFLAKIKEEAEDEESESSEPWEDTETSENEYEDDEKTYEDSSTTSKIGHDHNTRFHAAFHAKKQSRLDQRRRIMQKPVHEAHTEL